MGLREAAAARVRRIKQLCMSADEFQELWKSYDAKLAASMELNRKLLEETRTGKIHRSFGWLIVCKLFMILLGVAWIVLCAKLAWHFRQEPFFLAAALILILVTSLTIAGYTVQLLLLVQINMSKSILGTQKQLAQLEVVIVGTYRLSILQAPVWTFFFLTRDMVAHMGVWAWVFQIGITAVFVVGVIWLYRLIRVENMEKKWMKKLLSGLGMSQIARARAFIREIGEYGAE